MAGGREEDRRAALALLAWQLAAGVDEVVGNLPVNRLESAASIRGRPPATPRPMPSSATARSAPAPAAAAAQQGPSEAVMAARARAREAETLEQLRDILAGFDGCALRLTARNLCFADGNPQARIMFVGEAPGQEEDIQGAPFVGPAGKLLDRMLAAIGLDRTSVYITNVVYWRPPGNRTPTPQETQICRPFVERQIELADPDVLVLLGNASASVLLDRKEGILRLRGKWFDFDTGRRTIPAMPTLHPAYLLRQPGQKRLAWRDFLAIRKALDG
ncbi:uracil-DNA glycosylase [Tepidamorphus gemmatus]|nr:uracil-DNA glycosylase [Tepidamorphus gemmatus]